MSSERFTSIRRCLQQTLNLTDAEAQAITEETTAAQLPRWTSAAHLELVFALEREFDVMFEAEDIAMLASVPAIDAAVTRMRAK